MTNGTDPLQALLSAGLLPASAFPPSSRYAGVSTQSLDPGDGSPPVRYLARRLLPRPQSMATLAYHSVVGGDRLELIAYTALGDAELWWRLADANACIDPADLTTTIGRRLRIPLPPGTPGGSYG